MTTSVPAGGPRTRQGHLAGPSLRLDRRVNAIRPDLADAALAGVVGAQRYADFVLMRGVMAVAMIRDRPEENAVAVSALLYGEAFKLFDAVGGWAWGQCLHDGYVGWLPAAALGHVGATVTHRVAAPSASVFAAPDIKSHVVATLPLNARIAATDGAGGFIAAAGGYLHPRCVRGITDFGGDPVDFALGFVGTPYVWGGRTRDGIDCSGLTQAALQASGVACPRDSDQQRDVFPPVAAADRRRGDLVVFNGHVGILGDADTVIHANAFWMTTLAEPLKDVGARLSPTGIRRPPPAA